MTYMDRRELKFNYSKITTMVPYAQLSQYLHGRLWLLQKIFQFLVCILKKKYPNFLTYV